MSKTVFFDVDTQLDFVTPAGALYVPGAELLAPQWAKLTRYAQEKNIQIIATADAHTEDDPEFKIWKPHCVAGTVGQQKLAATISPNQIMIEKQHYDCFTNPKLAPLLRELAADRYVVYGVVTEYCVKCAAMGALETGAQVELVMDAIQSLDSQAGQAFLQDFTAKGGQFTTTAQVTFVT